VFKIPFSYSKAHEVLLQSSGGQAEVLWHSTNTPLHCIQEVMSLVGPIHRQLKPSASLLQEINAAYARDDTDAAQVADEVEESVDLSQLLQEMPIAQDLLEMTNDAPVVRMINSLLKQACRDGVSDIHLEVFERQSVVRFRVDGHLRDIVNMRKDLHSALVSRIKIMAALDIAEKRLPQDGRISLRVGGRPIDVRVSTLPTAHGERVVLRILDKDYSKLDLVRQGMSEHTFLEFDALIHRPHGIVLVTGPTGSGKTTTLYGALLRLRSTVNNIMTVEDPIEYNLDGIGQTQVNPRIDMNFARALRAILRQDPDIVMIGEIRDLETAQIAIQASLTGHLVLATLHTNDAPSAVTRLIDMGIEPFLLSSSLLGVLGQRLIRLICASCQGVGCSVCGASGFSGRAGVYELMTINDAIRDLIHQSAAESSIRQKAQLGGMRTMAEDAQRWFDAGKTTQQEILRVTGNSVPD
jgi:general secretion pathway protein E